MTPQLAFWLGLACGWLLASLLPLALLGLLMLVDRWQRRKAIQGLTHPERPRPVIHWCDGGSRSW